MTKLVKKNMTVWEAKNEVNKFPLTTVEQCDEYLRVMLVFYGERHSTAYDLILELKNNLKGLMEADLHALVLNNPETGKDVIKTLHESMEAMTNQIKKLETAYFRLNVEQA